MDVVTGVIIGLKVLNFLQEMDKNNLKDGDRAADAARLLLDANEGEAKQIVALTSELDDDFLHNILEGVGGIVDVLKIFKDKD